MMYATLMGILFLASLLFVVVLVGAVVWGGVSRVIKRANGAEQDNWTLLR